MLETPPKIGGWLWLIGLVAILFTARMLFESWHVFAEVFGSGTWELLTQPGILYNKSISNLVIFQVSAYSALAALGLVSILLFIFRFRMFIPLFVSSLLLYVIVTLIDCFGVYFAFENLQLFSFEQVRNLLIASFTALGVGFYLVQSTRARATFVRRLFGAEQKV